MGQNVTLAANVAPNPSATVMPTGVVTFLDGTTILGTGVLDSFGNASLTLNTLAIGVHAITASYPGDVNFASSVSNMITLPVQGTPARDGRFVHGPRRGMDARAVLAMIPI